MISHTGGLKRQFHHVKTNKDEQEGWEPVMVLIKETKIGRSFIVPLSAMWKYISPLDNRDAYPSDLQDFQKIVSRALRDQKIAQALAGEIAVKAKAQARDDLNGCAFAAALWNTDRILPCVGWNLYKLMIMFDIEVSPQAAAQLLLFIQDGIEELKNMPELPPEKELTAGEVTLWEGSTKIVSKDLTVTESDLVMEEEGSA